MELFTSVSFYILKSYFYKSFSDVWWSLRITWRGKKQKCLTPTIFLLPYMDILLYKANARIKNLLSHVRQSIHLYIYTEKFYSYRKDF
jgi:hypothetical protein